MEQLLAHLIGDYWLQSNWMAQNKEKDSFAAMVHVFAYGLPFQFLGVTLLQCVLIIATHFVIDRFAVAKRISKWMLDPNTPPHIADWIHIIRDNSMHLFLNFLIIGYV